MVITNPVENGPGTGRPELDLLVGVVSFANYSALENSGTGLVRITPVANWVNEIISDKVRIHCLPRVLEAFNNSATIA